MLSVPQMLWLVKHAREKDSRALLIGDSAQHRAVERGDALRILEQSASVRYVELLQTQRQKVPALKAAIEEIFTGATFIWIFRYRQKLSLACPACCPRQQNLATRVAFL